MSEAAAPVLLSVNNLSKTFVRENNVVWALDGVSIEARPAALTALVGPDGSGKTTLLRLIAGLMPASAGTVTVLGFDAATQAQSIQDRISYMPQRFGLYDDLTVQENLDLYADLNGVSPEQRAGRYPQLMNMTGLHPFRSRLAGKLSGGMKQKLGLACTLVRSPQLLLLDEPTVGVDPLSRRELWQIVHRLVEQEGLTAIVSTSYMDEAEQCSQVVVLREGRVLTQGPPEQIRRMAAGRSFLTRQQAGEPARELQARLMEQPGIADAVPQGGRVRLVFTEPPAQADDGAASVQGLGAEPVAPSLEDALMILQRERSPQLPAAHPASAAVEVAAPGARMQREAPENVIEVVDVVRKFGDFTAVDRSSFTVGKHEVFGLLGPNGAGKTTMFRMLCGLLPVTAGSLSVAGADLRRARAEARQHIGYVAQKFALYAQLTVRENLEFFAGAYGLRNSRLRERIAWAIEQLDLTAVQSITARDLPGGFQRRLAMAAALMHEPAILFLDEPTSGADPFVRREFWRRITQLAREGTTIVVTTHFMEEAEYCDRVMIQDAGRMLALGTPEEIRRDAADGDGPARSMEDAFIAIVKRSRDLNPGAIGEAA